jgi:hypothetical protein
MSQILRRVAIVINCSEDAMHQSKQQQWSKFEKEKKSDQKTLQAFTETSYLSIL